MRRVIVLRALALALVACSEPQPRAEEGWNEGPADDIPHFDVPAMCPAPNTPQAASYVDHGGSAAALEWLLLLNMMAPGPEVHVVHHYGEPEPPRYWQRSKPAPPRRAFAERPRAPQVQTPSQVTRTFNTAASPTPARALPTTVRIKAPSPAGFAPKSPSYGFRAGPSPRPAVTRPSVSAKRR